MTSLIAWLAIDQRQPSAMYIATDSRITLPDGDRYKTWDYGRKVFASKTFPEIFGYCGDALFPTQILSQIVELIDTNLIFDSADNPDSKLQKILTLLNLTTDNYFYPLANTFILYGTKSYDPSIKKPVLRNKFLMAKLDWSEVEKKWNGSWINLPQKSGPIVIEGSGKRAIIDRSEAWEKSSQSGTSRGVFGLFCSALLSRADEKSGGPPQLVGIRRNTNGISFGIIYNQKRYYFGLPIENIDNFESVIWHNILFEVCDGNTLELKPGYQRGYRQPQGIGNSSSNQG
jgi:hypothetical protein